MAISPVNSIKMYIGRKGAGDQRAVPAGAKGAPRLEWLLFGLALLVYAFTRLYALERFPIYFFADEATHAVLAADLLQNGFRDAHGHLFPLYFEAAGLRWTPLLSVYVHVLPVALFGKSIAVTRATAALVTLVGVAAVALTARLIFRCRYWWTAVLFLAVAPNWLLHSRTGFETVMMASFYALFLLFYLLYRTRAPAYLYPAVVFGAATFYTYSNGQMVMAATAFLLLLSDLPYHLRHWKTVLIALGLVAVLALPIVRFRLTQPDSLSQHLRAIDSYWFKDMPLAEKLRQFARTYAYGLSPQYWFTPNAHDLARHRFGQLGHLSIVVLPFFLVGLGVSLARIRQATYRVVLLCALAAPAGAALVDVTITRVMAFNVPAALFCTLGLEAVMRFLAKRIPAPRRAMQTAAPVAVFAVMSLASLLLLRYALVGGPRWFSDYGLYGMQYGARQLFEEAIPEYLAQDPDTQIMVSSTWANGADTFIRFFIPKALQSRVQMLNIDHYMDARRTLDDHILLVMTPSEYEEALASPKFKTVDVDRIIRYPDGKPGFYFARLTYADDLDELLAAERTERSRPVTDQAMINGVPAQITHSLLEAGQVSDLFDADPFTLVRGLEANPIVFDITFAEPRPVETLTATFGSMDFALTVSAYAPGATEPVVYAREYRDMPPDPTVEIVFDRGPELVEWVVIEALHLTAGPEAKIHVRDLVFTP